MDGAALSGLTPFQVSSLIQGMPGPPPSESRAASSSEEAAHPVVDIRLRRLMGKEGGRGVVDDVVKSLDRPVMSIQSPVNARLVKVWLMVVGSYMHTRPIRACQVMVPGWSHLVLV